MCDNTLDNILCLWNVKHSVDQISIKYWNMSSKAKLNRRIKPSQLRVHCGVLGAMRKHGDPKSCDFVSSRSRRSHSILYEFDNVERRQIISTYIRGADTDWHWAMRWMHCVPQCGNSHELHIKNPQLCEAKDMIFCGFETLLLAQNKSHLATRHDCLKCLA